MSIADPSMLDETTKKEQKSIYDLKLHESINLPHSMKVIRVAGGWIYNFYMTGQVIFVPYNNEFQ